ncbi:hypothetical protein FP568_15285 [Pandoraea pnomenusa]|uniref:hypothetical protein n=1 Tax=Pandoraea pnomenusa TaxID=93220 RepID=UPI0011986F3C|nr:hypothetical protein [Pandoraea pnomenusa]QDX22483.1 hypothetical protein FP568_15285 [Pandoraea pnomenusa]
MRKFVMVSPNFWVGQTGRDLRRVGSFAQLAALYLLSNPLANYTGLYRLPIIYIANDLGLTLDQVRAALAAIEQTGFARYDENSEYVWIVEGARHQLGEHLKASDHKVKFVNKEFAAISKSCPFLHDYFNKYASCLHLKPRHDMPELITPRLGAEEAPMLAQPTKPGLTAATALQPEAVPVVATAAEQVPAEEVEDEAALAKTDTTQGLWRPTDVAYELASFLAERERRGLPDAGSKAVAKLVLTFSAQHDDHLATKLLKTAAAAGDYDIVNHALYAAEVLAKYDI